MADHFLDPLAKLRRRVDELAASHGLYIAEMTVQATSEPGGPFRTHMVVAALEDWATAERDEEFEAVLRSAAQAEREIRAEQARDGIVRLADSFEERGEDL